MTTIDLNRVAVFVRVAEAGSFTAAARQLAAPVSSVSRAVSHLERELDVRLLHRTTSQLTLTEAGQQFLRRMQLLIGEAEEAARAVASFAAAPSGVVRITAPSNFAVPHLSGLMSALVQLYPELQIDLNLTNRTVDMIAEGVDLAIRGGILGDSTLVARKIAGGELGVYAAPAYLRRRGRPRRPAELVRHACLSYRGRNGKFPWRLRGPRGETTIDVSGPLVSDDMGFLCDAAGSGIGLALLPIEVATPALRAGSLVRVLPRYRYEGGGIYLVWPSQKLVPARVVVVREFLIDRLSRLFKSHSA